MSNGESLGEFPLLCERHAPKSPAPSGISAELSFDQIRSFREGIHGLPEGVPGIAVSSEDMVGETKGMVSHHQNRKITK